MFLPLKGGSTFISNRDESPKRQKARHPAILQGTHRSFLAPIDPEGGGTWIATNTLGEVIILLNGGFDFHQPGLGGYRKSRGLIVTEMIGEGALISRWKGINLDNIEPFTLVMLSSGELIHAVWDGSKKHQFEKETSEAHIWSSSTLYKPEAILRKRRIFEEAVERFPNTTALLDHLSGFRDPEQGFFIARPGTVDTLSTTIIELRKGQSTMQFRDHLDQTETELALKIIDESQRP